MTTDNRLWRVTRAGRGDGDAVELEVRGDDSEHVTTWLLSYGDGWDRVQARTAREAVATWVVLAGFAPTAAEILAPGEPSRAELAARSTAAEARVAELLSDRAEAAEVLVTEVERAQTAERRAAELTAHVEDLRDTVCNLLAEIGDPAHLCNAVPECTMHATWECADDGYSTGACDAHREGRAGEWHPAPRAAVLRSLDGVSR